MIFNQLLKYNMGNFNFEVRYWYFKNRAFLDILLVFLSQSLIYCTTIVYINSTILSIILSSIPFTLVYFIWRALFIDKNEYNGFYFSAFFFSMGLAGLICNIVVTYSVDPGERIFLLSPKVVISSLVLGTLISLMNVHERFLKLR